MLADRVEGFTFPFVLDEKLTQADQPLIYRPWGTRMLKVKLRTNTAVPVLWVRPQNVLQEETALGIFKAYADDTRAIHLTWGGGHEIGPCVKTRDALSAFETGVPLKVDEKSYLYFNLTHAGAELPASATVTLKAFEWVSRNGKTDEHEYSKLKIRLKLPPGMPLVDEIMRMIPGESDGTWIVSQGHYLPSYDSRWWPSPTVEYMASERPPIFLKIEPGKLRIDWSEPGNSIAIIEDYTNPSALLLAETLAFDLFVFDQWSFVLRVWLFWVDKYVGGGRFLGRHEIPDAERFDLIIRRKDGRVIIAGTDLHWREVWARVLPGKILRATLGMPRETVLKMVKEKWSAAWNDIWAKSFHQEDQSREVEGINNPVDPYIRRLAEREATVTVKASGTEAHLPTLHNVEQRRPAVMTSSDVRLG